MSIGDHDFQITIIQDRLDVAKRRLRSMPVGTIDWRMQRKEVVALDEELHQLRLARMSHDQANAGGEVPPSFANGGMEEGLHRRHGAMSYRQGHPRH